MSKQKKYRLIESINNVTGSRTYIIEKRRRFLFWTWWSQDYLFDVQGRYDSCNKDDMLNMLSILNGELKWTEAKVIK